MSDPERYVTEAEVRAELPFDAADFPLLSDEQFSSALKRALGTASEFVETWTETVFAPTSVTKTLSRPPDVEAFNLPLPDRPVRAVTSITVDGTDLTEPDDYVVQETHLELVAAPSVDIEAWPPERRLVTVTWTYGYEEPPGPVREAIIRLVRNALEQIETDGINAEGSWQYRPPEKLKRECQQMVRPYRAPSYYGGATVV